MAKIKEPKVRYVTDTKGIKKEVIISIKDYNELIEDLNDLAIIAERKGEETVDHKVLLKDLKNDRLL